MKAKIAKQAFEIIREVVHRWKPISWAGYDDDQPDMDPSEPGYEAAKSMLCDELDGTVKSIVKQLDRVQTENDLYFLLHRAFSELDDRVPSEECKKYGAEIYNSLKKVGAL